MKKMRLLITVSISTVLITAGCGASRTNVKEEVKKQCEELMIYLGEDDTNGIKEMFCTAVSESKSFDNDVLEAVDFFEGEVNSYDVKGIGSDEKTKNGNTEIIHVSPKIWDIETSTGKRYKVSYYAYIANSKNPEYVGISEIQIKGDDGEEFKLGDYSLANPK